MPVVVIFDKRLTSGVAKPLTACNASPANESIVVFSDGATPLATIVAGAAKSAAGIAGKRELAIMCHGLEEPSTDPNGNACGVVGGQGLRLGAENLTQQNIKLVGAWKGLFSRILILACQAAFTSAPREPCKAPASGKAFCSSIAAETATPVIASGANQMFSVDATGVAETLGAFVGRSVRSCTVDFGPFEGTAAVFDPSGGTHLLMMQDLKDSELMKYLDAYPFGAPMK